MMHSALFALTGYRQFILYKLVPRVGTAKMDKIPCDWRTGTVGVSAHDPAYWTDAETAERTAAAWGAEYGVGFAFTEHDPFWFLDIDSCLVDGQWSQLAQDLCRLLAGAAIEVSQSGTGLHIFGIGAPPAHGCTNKALGLEFYHTARFAALTGVGAVGDAATDLTPILPALVAAYFPPGTSEAGESQEWTEQPCAEWRGPEDDAELLRRAMMSRSTASAFGTRACFADLWLANEPALRASYPDASGRPYDCSAADAALAQHLSFWTGKDCARISRLMQNSALVRDKWGREDYLPRTILGAVGRQLEVLQDTPTLPVAAPVDGQVRHTLSKREGNGFMPIEMQPDYFAGCIYISGQDRALVPGGAILKPAPFRVRYGGFLFNMDTTNTKTSKDAWEAWTQNQVYLCPQVEGTCFKPNLPPLAIVERFGQRFINTYVPVTIARKQGDPSRFLTHLAKVLPDERDRTILLSYMAAIVQYQGIKFQWAPLLQGVQGNGKSLFSRCVEQAVGSRYTHWPKASKLSKDFNAWMVGKVFYAVEDIYVPDSRREILEDLKPMITAGTIEIEAKGVDQAAMDICGNFIFNSNHRDAIRKTDDDRRFCILFCAQQTKADLTRDAISGNYFPDLYDWLKDDGYAIVSDYLYTYQIPAEFNPAGECQRAPITTSTKEAIAASMGSLEQEILENVEQGSAGFCGDFISTVWLDRLLERLRLSRLKHSQRKEILEQMGYVKHPALPGGRTNNPVLPDNTKPTLFVKAGSLAAQIGHPAAVAKAYEEANKQRGPAGLPFAARA